MRMVSDSIPRRGRVGRGFGRVAFALLVLALLVLAVFMQSVAAQQSAQLPAQMARPEGWWIQVKNAASVSGAAVLLGDIAEPRGDLPAAAWKDLAARPLWAAPEKPGHQTALTRERLGAMLRHYLPDHAAACVLPQQIVVQRGGSVLDGETVTRRVVAFLTERGKALAGEIEITGLRVPEYVFFQSPRDTLDISMAAPVRPGRVNLMLEVKSGEGRPARRFAASGFVNLWRAVACAARPINRLEQLTPEMVVFKRKNLAYYPTAWDGTGGPWRVARSVGTEQVIGTEAIEPVPVIARGGKVNLVYQGGSIRLSVKAEALGDAGVGQRIEVRNLQSNRKILATVQDANTVVVR